MNKMCVLRIILSALSTILFVDVQAAQVQCGCPNSGVAQLASSLENAFAGCCGQESALLTDLDELVVDCCQTVSSDIALTLAALPNLAATCTEFLPDFNLCCSEIEQNFQSTFSIIAALTSVCGATPITTPTSISAPGAYCLESDITGNIIIASDRVILDLNGHLVNGQVTINSSLVRVKNGSITGGTNGIVINNARRVIVEDISIFGCSGVGITIQLTQEAIIKRVSVDSCASGINCTNAAFTIDECVLTALSNSSGTAYGISCFSCGRSSILNTYIANVSGLAQNASGVQVATVGTFLINNCVIENVIATGTGNVVGISVSNSSQVNVSKCEVKRLVSNQGECFGIVYIGTGIFESTDLVKKCRVLNIASAATTGRVYGFSAINGFGNVFVENECSGVNGGVTTQAAGFAFQDCAGVVVDRCAASNLTNASGFLAPADSSSSLSIILNECNATSITGTTTLFNGYYLNDGSGVVNRCTADEVIGIGFKVGGGIASASEWSVVRSMAINSDIGFEKPASVSGAPAGVYNVAGLCTTDFSNWQFVDAVGTQIVCPGNSGPQIGYNAAG